MMVQGKCWSRVSSGILVVLLAYLLAGCSPSGGGGDGGGGGDTDSRVTPPFVDLEANPGAIVAIRVGDTATLNGAFSTSSSISPISYAWKFTYKPEDSNATLINANTVSPSFLADVRGVYRVELVISSGGVTSARTIAIVQATAGTEEPTGPKSHINLNSNCYNCHKDEFQPISVKNSGHISTSTLCQACHSTFGYDQFLFVDHDEVFGLCSECHNGVLAIGKSQLHVPTAAECSDCHNTTSFLELNLDGSFDHTGVTRDCMVCHNGIVATGKHEGHDETEADCYHCHISTENFADVVFDHGTIGDTPCVQCHNNEPDKQIGKPANHPVTSDECGMCHNTRTFVFDESTSFDHTPIDFSVQPCAECHNNTNARGLTPNHMPIDQDCQFCHSPGTFETGFFDHANVTECASCHDGEISTGKHPDHLQTTADCSVCHTDTTDFRNATFDHTGISNGCIECHNNVTSTGKPNNHIPAQDECELCHIPTGVFADIGRFTNNVHPQLSDGCEGCHNGRFPSATGKPVPPNPDDPPLHLPTDQDCLYCHSHTAISFAVTSFTHEGIIDNCNSCHAGTAYDGFGAIGQNVGHRATTEDCGLCHNVRTFVDGTMDHVGIVDNCVSCHANDKSVDHLPTNEDCSVCHTTGSFAGTIFNHQGIVDNCVSCHNGTNATDKPIGHIPTNEDCSVCHNTTVFAGAKFDHQGIVDNCITCHNGNTAIGKHEAHVPTNEDCHVCHRTTGFIPATFDHQGIVDNCVSCHDGTFAIGKPLDHVQTNQDCGVCHTTTTFIGAGFDHTGIVDNCASCHNGTDAPGKHAAHIDTSLDCSNCHTTATFVGGSWDHQGVTGNCISCHDGRTATGKPNGHFQTTEDCNTCHSTNAWAPINYRHPNNSNYPGNHNARVTCISCHRDNSQTINWRFPTYEPSCAGCHANDYDAGEHDRGLSRDRNCGESGCHRVSDRNWD